MRFGGLRELIVLFPRLAGLIARLAGDPQVPARVKAVLGMPAVFLASPVDLIPAFIPVVWGISTTWCWSPSSSTAC
jgi:uncharacterized membrane protein YkvA (DUF1232 family)